MTPSLTCKPGPDQVIRKELDDLRHAAGFQPFRGRSDARPAASDGIGHLTHDAGDWSVYYLSAGGVDCSAQQARCPKTARLLRGLPCANASAFFSVLAPGTHICAHCGPGNYRLRLHLGLHVPQGEGCRIRCADQVRRWREGEVLVLDDAFEHEVWNEAASPRVVLCVDVRRLIWLRAPPPSCIAAPRHRAAPSTRLATATTPSRK